MAETDVTIAARRIGMTEAVGIELWCVCESEAVAVTGEGAFLLKEISIEGLMLIVEVKAENV